MRIHPPRILVLLGILLPLTGCVTTPGNYYGSSLDPYCCTSGGSVVYYDSYDPWAYYGPSYGPYDYRYGYSRPRGHGHGHHDGHRGRPPPEVVVVKPPRKPPAIFDPRPEDYAKPPPRRNPRDPGRTPHREPSPGHATKPSLPLLMQQREQRAQQQAPRPQQHRPEPTQRPSPERREPPRQDHRREDREQAVSPRERPSLGAVMRDRQDRNR